MSGTHSSLSLSVSLSLLFLSFLPPPPSAMSGDWRSVFCVCVCVDMARTCVRACVLVWLLWGTMDKVWREESERGRGREAVCVSDSLEASHLAASALSVCAQWPGSHVKVLSHSGMDHLTVNAAMSCSYTNSAERIHLTHTYDEMLQTYWRLWQLHSFLLFCVFSSKKNRNLRTLLMLKAI